MATRQNPGGTRYGFECTEEKDYYPYWHPSPWKDIVVFADHKSQCDFYQSESQNVKAKNYWWVSFFLLLFVPNTVGCSTGSANAMKTNNERDCSDVGGTWATYPSHGLKKPKCEAAPLNRQNHLGNGVGGVTNNFNWTLPTCVLAYIHIISGLHVLFSRGQESCVTEGRCACVLRIRYNITVGDYPDNVDSRNSSSNSPVKEDPTVMVNIIIYVYIEQRIIK